ncbi:hypothetical protein F480_06410 [Bibersteinia trehalosi Y31]|uniref:DNA gyrase subunit B n=1 Tax=Bibersteinia trehalosi Y31 TaxID=1261658 RepID=A0A179CVU8_BIBTR|nr:hypothetical protein [Bibersteinia trehalosi]OAQ14026.1 hypothetical protein F480_06410 [Bibersteinia trehalosi Y31]
MKRQFSFLITSFLFTTSLAYPLIWLWQGSDSPILGYLPFLLALCWGAKAGLQAVGLQQFFAILMAIILLIVGLSRSLETMYWYPIIINGIMLVMFGGSLWQNQTIIERLARLQDPNLPEEGVRYTRKVTQLWCGVFILNIVISTLLIAAEQFAWWAIYTGVIAYVIMGVVMGGEWLYRKIVIQR